MKCFDFAWRLVVPSKIQLFECLQCFRHYGDAKNTKMVQCSNTRVSMETGKIINEENNTIMRKTRRDWDCCRSKYKSACCLPEASCCHAGT